MNKYSPENQGILTLLTIYVILVLSFSWSGFLLLTNDGDVINTITKDILYSMIIIIISIIFLILIWMLISFTHTKLGHGIKWLYKFKRDPNYAPKMTEYREVYMIPSEIPETS